MTFSRRNTFDAQNAMATNPACKSLNRNDKHTHISLVSHVPNEVYVMLNRYAHASVVVVGIGCGNRTVDTNVT
jgi:hypothetical protein